MIAEAPAGAGVTEYARAVIAGEEVAGPWVRLACERHLRDLTHEPEADYPYRFDEQRAERVMNFFRFVQLYEGEKAGEVFELQPFQRFLVGSLFGWLRRDDGRRRFSTAFILTGKGNGKTPLAAVLGLYMLMADGEEGAQVYTAATKYDQAMIAFRDANMFASGSPWLASRLVVDKTNLAHPRSNSFMRPIASRERGQSGPRPSCNIVDEIHEMDDPAVLNMLRRGTKARRAPLTVEVTNAGEGQEGVAWEHYQHSLRVLRQVVEDDQWFAYICGLDEGDEWTDEKVWLKVNPGLGTILPWEYVRAQVREAQQLPSVLNNVKRLNFCIWTAGHTAWLDMEAWDRCQAPREAFAAVIEEAQESGGRCFAGTDLSSTVAMTAYALGWRLPVAGKAEPESAPPVEGEDSGEPPGERALQGRVALRVQFFLPEDGLLEREQRDGVPYQMWADAGYITLTPGNVVDYEWVRAAVRRSREDYGPRQVGFDPWNARDTIGQLMAEGAPVVEVPQSYTHLSDACKQLERLVKAGNLVIEENPVLWWHASNAVVKRDPNGNIRPDRSGERAFIDGISATVTMLTLLLRDAGDDVGDMEISYIDF